MWPSTSLPRSEQLSAMKQKTRRMLSELCAKHTKRSLVELWNDIRLLSREEFETELNRLFDAQRSTTQKPVRAKTGNFPGGNDPAARIASLLRATMGLTEKQARALVTQALVARGYPASDIPSPGKKNFEQWLSELLRVVPSSEVMDVAQSIQSRLK